MVLFGIKMAFINYNNMNGNFDILHDVRYFDIDVNPRHDIDYFDVINLRLKHRRDDTRPSMAELSSLNVKPKFNHINYNDEKVDELFMCEIDKLKQTKFSSILDMEKIILVDLNQVMIFKYLKPRDIPAGLYLIGFVASGGQHQLQGRKFYESFPSYNELKRRNAVQIVTHDGTTMRDETKALMSESYEKLDQQLEPSTKIIIVSDSGVLKSGQFFNERGRTVQLVEPGKVLASDGGGTNIWS